ASQVNGIIEDINELSPALADVYAVLKQHQIFVINEALRTFRDDAWRFASLLAAEPSFAQPATIWMRDRRVAHPAQRIFAPPGLVGLIQWAVDAIAARENRDVLRNIHVLNEIAKSPAPISTVM